MGIQYTVIETISSQGSRAVLSGDDTRQLSTANAVCTDPFEPLFEWNQDGWGAASNTGDGSWEILERRHERDEAMKRKTR